MFAFKISSINVSGKTRCPRYFLDAHAACLPFNSRWYASMNFCERLAYLLFLPSAIILAGFEGNQTHFRIISIGTDSNMNHELCCQFPNCRTTWRLCLFERWITSRPLQGWAYGAKKRCRHCPHWAHILGALWQIFLLLLFSGPISKVEYIRKLSLLWRCHFQDESATFLKVLSKVNVSRVHWHFLFFKIHLKDITYCTVPNWKISLQIKFWILKMKLWLRTDF